jgi:hypothetical protein
MKKLNVLLTAVALGLASFASAQITLNVGLGYHGGAFSNNVGTTTAISDQGVTTMTANNYSLGGGIPLNLGVGIGITDNISVDANLEYRLGSEVEIFNEDETGLLGKTNTTRMSTSNQIRFVPSLVFHNEGSGLYGRVGAVIPVGGKTTTEVKSTSGSTELGSATIESKGAASFGMVGAVGMNVEISDGLTFFGEFQVVSLAIKGTSQEMTAYSDALGNSLSDLPVSSKQTEFLDEVVNDGSTQDPTKPTQAVAGKTSFGSMGINVGIKLNIGG